MYVYTYIYIHTCVYKHVHTYYNGVVSRLFSIMKGLGFGLGSGCWERSCKVSHRGFLTCQCRCGVKAFDAGASTLNPKQKSRAPSGRPMMMTTNIKGGVYFVSGGCF